MPKTQRLDQCLFGLVFRRIYGATFRGVFAEKVTLFCALNDSILFFKTLRKGAGVCIFGNDGSECAGRRPLLVLERQWRKKLAGVRTMVLAPLGSNDFVSLSSMVASDTSPTRIAAQVVSGIGFLAGGIILRDGLVVKGSCFILGFNHLKAL